MFSKGQIVSISKSYSMDTRSYSVMDRAALKEGVVIDADTFWPDIVVDVPGEDEFFVPKGRLTVIGRAW